ncbi:MAG: amidohydrolase family protein [Pyrinomonadaceae bacterium]
MRSCITLLLLFGSSLGLFGQGDGSSDPVTLAITNVTVIDMTGRGPQPGMTVIVTSERITKIAKTKNTKPPNDAHVIDGSGKFLIPALWDMHVHVLNADRMLPLFVANGVLEVRDLGVPKLDDVLLWKTQSTNASIVSPRIVTAGRLLDGDPSASPDYSIVVRNADEARKAVHGLRARGVDLIKVYDVLSREAYFAIADESKKLGLAFVGHTPTAITTIEASDAGQKSIEHLGKILEDCSDSPEKIRAKQNESINEGDYFAFTTRLGRVYDVILSTYSRQKANNIFARFRRNKTWQVPTLAVKNGRTFIDELDAKGDPRAKYVEASQRNYWKPQVGFFSRYRTPEYIAAAKRYFQKELDLVGEMNRSGVPIMAGTDTPNAYVIAGFSLHDELELLVKAGLTPMEALRSATRNPAEYSGEAHQKGTVEIGKIANLIVLDANPLNDIKNTTRINAVIQMGKFLSRSDLDKLLLQVEVAANRQPEK